MNESRARGHIPAIDGLRALAVLSILIYHIDARLLPGGFAGVDVFFVISGFVVALASRGLADQGLGSFLLAFYRRRVVRILPALTVCLILVQALVLLVVPVVAKRSWDGDWTGMAAALAASNVQLWHSAADYFSAGPELNPYTHTWSLGVEEQFYLLFPLLGFFTLYRRAGLRGSVPLAVLVAASIGAAAWLTGPAPTFAFYMMVTRFWQLGLGVLLYALVASPGAPAGLRQRLKGSAGWLGLIGMAAMAGAFVLCRPERFPWPDALLPTAATALLIALGTLAPEAAVSRLLSARLLRHFGAVSYSLYLWHWPVVVLMRWTTGLESAGQKLVAFAASWALAVLSYRMIENPIRRSAWLARRPHWQVVLAGLALMVATALSFAGSIVVRPHVSLSATAEQQVWGMTRQAEDPRCPLVIGHTGAANGMTFTARGCAAPDERTLFVLGDSHAMAYQRLSGNLAMRAGIGVVNYGETGCALLPDPSPWRAGLACRQFLDAAMRDIAATARRGDWLLLPGLRTPRLIPPPRQGPVAFPATEIEATARALRPLLDAGLRVVIEAPKPVYAIEPMRCADRFNRTNPACLKPVQTLAEAQQWRAQALDALALLRAADPRIEVWDPLPLLCTTESCPPFIGGNPVTWDGDHLTAWAQDRLTPSLAAALGVKLSPR